MHKWVGIIFLLLLLGLCSVAYLYGVSLRLAGIIEGRVHLKMAANDYAQRGYVTNYGSTSYQIWLSTNIVSVNGTQYQCFITTKNDKFGDEGSLGMTTNQVFIWLDHQQSPKIIGMDYRPPIFPPHF